MVTRRSEERVEHYVIKGILINVKRQTDNETNKQTVR